MTAAFARGQQQAMFWVSFEKAGCPHSDSGSGASLNDTNWHHIAATYSMFDEIVRVYVDGGIAAERKVSDGSMLLAETPVRLGVGTIGVIDEVIVYPRALSPEEVRALAE